MLFGCQLEMKLVNVACSGDVVCYVRPCLFDVVFSFLKLFGPILRFCITYNAFQYVSVLFIVLVKAMNVWRGYQVNVFPT